MGRHTPSKKSGWGPSAVLVFLPSVGPSDLQLFCGRASVVSLVGEYRVFSACLWKLLAAGDFLVH